MLNFSNRRIRHRLLVVCGLKCIQLKCLRGLGNKYPPQYTEKSIVDGTVFMLETVGIHTFVDLKVLDLPKRKLEKNMFPLFLDADFLLFL